MPRLQKQPHEAANDTSPIESEAQPQRPDSSYDPTDPSELIARRAYERFRMRGGEHGHDQDDWFEAEREVPERSQE